MFIGHYAASLVLKKVEKRASLGFLFLGVQFVDILFFPFVLLGIERFNIVENFTQSTHFELEYMPYTHSLLAAFLWAGLAYIVIRIIFKNNMVALVMGIAVLSHWFLDLIVHTPDLPLWIDSSTKLGLGLWNNAVATYLLEAILLGGALWLYLRSSTALSSVGKYGMCVFAVILLLINANNIFGPLTGDNKVFFSIVPLVAYFLFAGVAFWLDGKRTSAS